METNIDNVTRHWNQALSLISDPDESWLASAVSTQRMQFLQLGLLPSLQLLHQDGSARKRQDAAPDDGGAVRPGLCGARLGQPARPAMGAGSRSQNRSAWGGHGVAGFGPDDALDAAV